MMGGFLCFCLAVPFNVLALATDGAAGVETTIPLDSVASATNSRKNFLGAVGIGAGGEYLAVNRTRFLAF